jgi:hypothetical protein
MSKQSSKAISDARRKRQARDPEAFKLQRAVHDQKYQQTHVGEIRARGRARYQKDRDRQLARANARYAVAPVPILQAALRRYYRLKSKLPPGQTEFPIIPK